MYVNTKQQFMSDVVQTSTPCSEDVKDDSVLNLKIPCTVVAQIAPDAT